MKKSLAILPEQVTLRKGGGFQAPLAWPPAENNDQPRALRGLARIVDGGLCHRCGSCIGICPTGVLGLDGEGYPTVVSRSSCTDCDLCVKVCPGDEFEFHKHHREMFGNEGDLRSTHGDFMDAFIGYSTYQPLR